MNLLFKGQYVFLPRNPEVLPLAHTHIGTTCQSSGVIIVGVLPFGERCVRTADSVKAVIWLVQARIMVCFYSSSYFSLVAIFCCLSGALDACCVFLPVKLASRKNAWTSTIKKY